MTRYDPSTIFPIFIVVVVILGLIYANTSRQKFLNQVIAQITPHDTDSPSPTPTESASPTPSPTIIPSYTPIATPSPRATAIAQINNSVSNSNANANNSDLNQFRYPNGKTISSSRSEIKMESSDSPDKITDWYKEKIKSLGMNTQSFVSTNTNNNVLNSLAAAGQGINIKVEIKRDAGASFTSINITH